MNKHNYLMALAMNSNVAKLCTENADIPVKITEIESEGSSATSQMTTFKCLVVNDDQIKYHAPTKAEYAKYAASDVRNTLQIGIASCRERVCM